MHNNLYFDQKSQILKEFCEGKIDVLYFTGNDNLLLNTSKELLIIVEDAHRISLSFLHQIRNLAMINSKSPKLLLLSGSKNPQAQNRLKYFSKTMNGSSLVDFDLKNRRDGSTLGFEKWGFNALKLINVSRDKAIIKTAKNDINNIVSKFPNYDDPSLKLLSYEISRSF